MLDETFVKEIVRQGARDRVRTIHDDPWRVIVAEERADGGVELSTFLKNRPDAVHRLGSIGALVAFLKSDQVKVPEWALSPGDIDLEQLRTVGGPVFVGAKRIVALPHYAVRGTRLTVDLTPSAELAALKAAAEGLEQKAMLRLLATDLFDAMGPGLELTLSSLSVTRRSEEAMDVALSGRRGTGGRQDLQVTWTDPKTGEKSVTIPQEYAWKGRLWEEFEETCQLAVVLEIDTDEKPAKFRLTPRGLPAAELAMRGRVVEALRAELAGTAFGVFEGEG